MALIKCPECGHTVSDKAPSCPNCGAPIATANIGNNAEASTQQNANQPSTNNAQPKSNKKLIITIIAIAVIAVAGVIFHFVHSNNMAEEKQAYELAMKSTDIDVLKQYLDDYDNAPQEHIDSINAHLLMLQQYDKEWTNVLVTNSRSAYEEYIKEHPNSIHKIEAMDKIDSLDWVFAQEANTEDAYDEYLEEHPNGKYVDEANNSKRTAAANTVKPDEKRMITSLMNTFFNSITNKDETALTSTVNSLLTSFLGKANATRPDVTTFLHKIYKNDVESITWSEPSDMNIQKKEVGDGAYEYTLTFKIRQVKSHTDGNNTETKFSVNAKVNPDGKISEFNMTKKLD